VEQKPKPEAPSRQQKSLPTLSLVAGLLSVWPYLIWVIAIPITRNAELPSAVENILGIIVLLIVPCNGIPFGLAGIALGTLALQRSRNIFSVIGILSGLLGCAGNIAYFLLL
jgi:hypothetical protein